MIFDFLLYFQINDPNNSNENINVQNSTPTVNVIPGVLTNSKLESLITNDNISEAMSDTDNKSEKSSNLEV